MSDIINEIFTETKKLEHKINASIQWCMNKTVTPPLQKLSSFDVSERTFMDLKSCVDVYFAMKPINTNVGQDYLFGVPIRITRDPLIDQDKPYWRPNFKQA